MSAVTLMRRLPKPQRMSDLEVADPSIGAFKATAEKLDGVSPSHGRELGLTSVTQQVVPLQSGPDGKMAWDAVLKQGSDKWAMWTRPEDAREKWSKPEELQKPGTELDMINTERTQKALDLALNSKMQSGAPKKAEVKEPEFIRYTPNPDAPGYTPNCKERVIKLVERQVDPFMPPRFKHKKVPRGPPSPPPPVHHSPAKKLTAKDQKDWKIPPCISNWKNVKGYTIPLDKRLAADGRNLQDVAVNDKFAALSENLYLAERKAREEIKIRNDMIRQKRVREEEAREQQLRELAAQARQQRSELMMTAGKDAEASREAEERKQRMDVLSERRREIERDQRLELAGKKNKKGRDEDRDISERIALGQAAQPTSQEAQFDSRLFNQTAGMDSGYHGGSDEKCNIYDKPLFADRSQAGIYKFDKDRLQQNEGRLAHVGTKSFTGAADGPEASSSSRRSAPVEFERENSESRVCGERRGAREREARGRGQDRSRSRRRARAGDHRDDDFGLRDLLEDTKSRR